MSQNYNINMKKFNGTDYDGLLPLAYNALNSENSQNSQLLDGKTYQEVLAMANQYADNYKFVIGVYVGNTPSSDYGKYQKVTLGFKPRYLIITIGRLQSLSGTGGNVGYIGGSTLGDEADIGPYNTGPYYILQYLDDGFQVGNHYDSHIELNTQGIRYIYFASP